MYKTLITLLVIVAIMPMCFLGAMGEKWGYVYGWVPGYSIAIAMIAKNCGRSDMVKATNTRPGNERILLYAKAHNQLKFARSILVMHKAVFSNWEWFENEWIECQKLIFSIYKTKTL